MVLSNILFPPQDDPAECGVCFTIFDDTQRRPRMLPCGHTFCSKCITKIIETMNITCPSCRVQHEAISADQFPINYSTEILVRHLKTLTWVKPSTRQTEGLPPLVEGAASSKGSDTPPGATLTTLTPTLEKFLKEQRSNVQIMTEKGRMFESQLEQYEVLLDDWTTQHLQLQNKLSDFMQQNNSALDLLKQENSKVKAHRKKNQEEGEQLKAALRSFDSVTGAEEVGKVLDQVWQCLDKTQDWNEKCQDLFPDNYTVTTCFKVSSLTFPISLV